MKHSRFQIIRRTVRNSFYPRRLLDNAGITSTKLAASSRLPLWVSDAKPEGAGLVGSAPSGRFRCWCSMCYLSWWDALVPYLMDRDDKTIMLNSIWSRYDIFRGLNGRVLGILHGLLPFLPLRIALLRV